MKEKNAIKKLNYERRIMETKKKQICKINSITIQEVQQLKIVKPTREKYQSDKDFDQAYLKWVIAITETQRRYM
jgi:hypothetical protein